MTTEDTILARAEGLRALQGRMGPNSTGYSQSMPILNIKEMAAKHNQ